MSFADNILAREEAEEFVKLLGEQSQRFWEELIVAARTKLPPVPTTAMTDEEAQAFDSELMPYGVQFRDWPIGTVPEEHLHFLVKNRFKQQLDRYVASDWFRRRCQRKGIG